MMPETERPDLDRNTPPARTVAEVRHDLRELAAIAAQITRLHPSVLDFCYSTSRWGEPDEATSAEALSRGVRPSAGGARRPIDEADPTLDALTGRAKQGARRSLGQADRAISEALSQLRAARQHLRKAIAEPRDRLIEPPGPEDSRYPRTATDPDLDEAKAAAQRRRDRGEG